MSALFQIARESTHGLTLDSEDPRTDALLYASVIVRDRFKRGYIMTEHDDGSITVAIDGCASVTFEKIRG